MTDLRASIEVTLVDNASPNAKKIAAATDGLRAAQLRAAQAAGAVAGAELQAANAALQEARAKTEGEGASNALARAELKAARAAKAVAQAELSAAKATSQHAQASSSAASSVATGAAATNGASTASRGLFRNLLHVTDAQKKQGRSAAEGVNIVTEFALGFGALSPATRQASVEMAGAANSAFAMGGAIGPLGVVLALVIGALPTAIKLFSDMGGAALGAAEAAREATTAFNESVAAELAARRAKDEQRAVETGDADVATVEAAAEVSRQRSRSLRAEYQSRARGEVSGGAIVELLGDLGSGILENQGGATGLDFRGYIQRREQERQARRRAEGRAERARRERIVGIGLPTARAREAQEALESAAGESRQASSVADAAAQRAVAATTGVTPSQRALLATGVAEGRLPEAVFDRLPTSQRATVRDASDRAIQARELAQRDEIAAQRIVVTQVDERRGRIEREQPGELPFAGLVRGGGGGGGVAVGDGEAIQRARSDDPAAEASRENARRTEENTAAMRDLTAGLQSRRSSSGDDAVLGGVE